MTNEVTGAIYFYFINNHDVDTSKFIDYKKGVFSFSFYLILLKRTPKHDC